MTEYPDSKKVGQLVAEYFERMSKTDKNYIMAAILRVECKLVRAGLKPVSRT